MPAKRRSPRQPLKSDDVLCDICQLPAVKSCLICQASYCETHLTPHLRDPVMMMKHRLTDPATFATSHLCRNHNQPLEMFCKTDQTPVCAKCMQRDHFHHEVVAMEKESKRIKVRRRGWINKVTIIHDTFNAKSFFSFHLGVNLYVAQTYTVLHLLLA